MEAGGWTTEPVASGWATTTELEAVGEWLGHSTTEPEAVGEWLNH